MPPQTFETPQPLQKVEAQNKKSKEEKEEQEEKKEEEEILPAKMPMKKQSSRSYPLAERPKVKKRWQKSKEDVAYLKAEFAKKQIWTDEEKIEIATRLGTTKEKIGKWNWEERRKLGANCEHSSEQS